MQSAQTGKGGRSLGNHVFRAICKAVFLGILSAQIAAAQSFAVRNPNHQEWPKAEAEKIYTFAVRVVQDEFKPKQPIRPQFTLVLGYEKDQMDVNTNELRLRKWDRRMFTEGVILFSFEQMMPTATKTRLVQRVLRDSDSVLTVDQECENSCNGADASAACPPGARPNR